MTSEDIQKLSSQQKEKLLSDIKAEEKRSGLVALDKLTGKPLKSFLVKQVNK